MGALPEAETHAAYAAALTNATPLLDACGAIAARHGLRGGVSRFPTGSMFVCAVGEDHVVKLYPPICRRTYEVERAALERAHGSIGVPVPAIAFAGELERWTYLVMSKLPGVAFDVVSPSLSEADRVRIASSLGSAVRQMHGLPTGGLSVLALDWPGYVDERIRGAVERQRKNGLDPRWLAQIPAYLDRARPLLLAETASALLHTELGPSHVLVEERGGRYEISGLIDFGDALVAPPILELPAVAIFIARGAPQVLSAFMAGYGAAPSELDATFRRAVIACTLLHPYSNLAWYLRHAPPPAGVDTLEGLEICWTVP